MGSPEMNQSSEESALKERVAKDNVQNRSLQSERTAGKTHVKTQQTYT